MQPPCHGLYLFWQEVINSYIPDGPDFYALMLDLINDEEFAEMALPNHFNPYRSTEFKLNSP